MREQSHKNEMSAAIRGDFRRLRERGVTVTLAPRDDQPPARGAVVDALPEPLPEPEPPPVHEPEADVTGAGLEPEVAAEKPPVRPGLLARFLGR